MGSVFDHCSTEDDAWHTFYLLACLCHPSQGGHPGDMEALCEQARRSPIGAAWPPEWTAAPAAPPLFDIFCRATKTANPFGASIAPAAGEFQQVGGPEELPGYRYGTRFYMPLASGIGNIELVFSAVTGAEPSAANRCI